MKTIPHQIYMSAREQAQAIYNACISGNIRMAQAMFNQICRGREALITVFMIENATRDGNLNSVQKFIVSVTR